MPQVSADTKLTKVEHILGSGTGTLDFAVQGETNYYTWDGAEDADWAIDDVARVENNSEDRFILYPEAEYFICEIEDPDEVGTEEIRCWCE